jgi:hypothetical protein
MNLDQLKAEEERLKSIVPTDLIALRNVQYEIAQLELEQRTQEQESKVQGFQLPYDYNDLFENSTANETIMELVQQALRQAHADHNAEIGKIHEDYRAQLKAADDKHADLQAQHDHLYTAHSQLQAEHAQTKLDMHDALTKRDAAVRELYESKQEIERLNGHIDDLRKDAAVGARNAMNVTDINVNDRLAELAKKAKESSAEKAARALERWNTAQPDLAVPELEVAAPATTFPATESTHDTIHNGDTETANVTVQPPVIPAPTFPETVQAATTGLGLANEKPGIPDAGATVEERLSALEARVNVLEGKAQNAA